MKFLDNRTTTFFIILMSFFSSLYVLRARSFTTYAAPPSQPAVRPEIKIVNPNLNLSDKRMMVNLKDSLRGLLLDGHNVTLEMVEGEKGTLVLNKKISYKIVKVSKIGNNGPITSFTAIVNPTTGKIVSVYDRPVIENFKERPPKKK